MYYEIDKVNFLQDFEASKARLRTLSTFTPTDQELRDLAGFYRSFLNAEKERNTFYVVSHPSFNR